MSPSTNDASGGGSGKPEDEVPDFLAAYSGETPPRRNLNNILRQDVLLMIGLIVTQWGHLSQHVDFLAKFWSMHPLVPEDLRKPKIEKMSFKQRLAHVRKVAPFHFHDARPNTIEELDKIVSKIANAQPCRDDLAHGTYGLEHNKDPQQVTVHRKGRHKTYRLEQLEKTARNISECTGTLLTFDQWAQLSKTVEAFRNLDIAKRDLLSGD